MDVAGGAFGHSPKVAPDWSESRGAVFMVHQYYRGKGGGVQVDEWLGGPELKLQGQSHQDA